MSTILTQKKIFTKARALLSTNIALRRPSCDASLSVKPPGALLDGCGPDSRIAPQKPQNFEPSLTSVLHLVQYILYFSLNIYANKAAELS
jgi:hypothetical protein